MYDTYRVCARRITRVRTNFSVDINNVHTLLSIPNFHYISVQIGAVHDKKKTSDGECGETARFVANAFKCAAPISGILLKRESLTRCKRGRWARSRQALLAVCVPDTVHCVCCIMCHTKIKQRKSVGFLALTCSSSSVAAL